MEPLTAIALAGSVVGLVLGGLSKGALGLGLPLIAVPIIALFMPVPQALALLTVPILVTNIWQSLQGGNLGVVWRRFWPMAAALMMGIGAGTQVLIRLDPATLYLVMGCVVLIQPGVRWLKPGYLIVEERQRWVGPMVAGFSGVLGGISGFYAAPLLVYLTMLRLPKDIFTAAIAMLFLLGGFALALFLAQASVLTRDVLTLSVAALVPAVAGIYIGTRIRFRISQAQFERGITLVMLMMGVSLIGKGLM